MLEEAHVYIKNVDFFGFSLKPYLFFVKGDTLKSISKCSFDRDPGFIIIIVLILVATGKC